MDHTDLQLSPEDAVIILKPDGTFETSFPHFKDHDVPEHVVMGAALVFALSDPDLCEIIRKCFENYCKNK